VPTPTRRLRRLTGPVALAVGFAGALTGCQDPTTGRPPAAGAAGVAAYTSSITTVTTKELGASWRAGCPVGAADLRNVRVAYWAYDGTRATGTLVVHRDRADAVARIFGKLYAQRFQIARIQPVAAYGADDDRSMAANNTSAFNCRAVTGGTGWSDHSYGTSIDLNPIQNPYVKGSTVLPPAGRPYADRTTRVPGGIYAGDATVAAFRADGWSWGGAWSSVKDYQHLSANNR
jgi:hypothetical protein